MNTMRFRSIWISDTHLGGKNVRNTELHHFLSTTESEYLYLVGDILDLWKLKRNWHWPATNTAIVNLILRKAEQGTRVFYLPGNHDAMLRDYCGSEFSGIRICHETIHTAADGGRFLVLHGDRFDCVIQNSEWLANIGSVVYDALLVLNRWFNRLRRLAGRDYFSISAWLKHKCKKAVNYMGDFEETLVTEIRRQQVDGVICGHIHRADLKAIGNLLYSNSGDWVESCTALAENHNGTLGLINWLEHQPATSTTRATEYAHDRYRDRCLAPTN